MASYSLHSYSLSGSSSSRSSSNDRRNIAEQGVGRIGESLGSTSNEGSSSAGRDEGARIEEPVVENRGVESLASSNNVEDANKVSPSNDDWVVQDVRNAYSKYLTTAAFRDLVDVQDIVESSVPDHAFSLRRCLTTDRVFDGWSSYPADFFFMYARVMKDFCLVISFDDFCTDVLCYLNVAPTQLHPNGWAYIRAFQFVYAPTIPLFFTHCQSRPGKKVGWLSLISQARNCLFKPFSSSYKHFKDTFIKITFGRSIRDIYLTGRSLSFPCIGPDPLLAPHFGHDLDYRRSIALHFLCLTPFRGVFPPEISSTPIGVKIRIWYVLYFYLTIVF